MATAKLETKVVERTVKEQVPDGVTLELSHEEAQALANFLGSAYSLTYSRPIQIVDSLKEVGYNEIKKELKFHSYLDGVINRPYYLYGKW
jgi:hypothetical protein